MQWVQHVLLEQSPFAAEMGDEWSEIVKGSTFPWYLERRQATGEIQKYHFEGNAAKYSLAETDLFL